MSSPFLSVFLAIASLILTARCEVYSAVKKSHGFKISEDVSGMVDIVQGYQHDAILYVNFSNSINETG